MRRRPFSGRARERRAGVGAALLAVALCAAPAAASPAARGLVVSPRSADARGVSYFQLRLHRGQSRAAGSLELHNPTRRRMLVALAAVDGQTLGTLGSSYAQPGSAAHGSTRWLHVAQRKVALAPGATASVLVSVAAPAGAHSGDYLAGVSVEQLGQAAKSNSRHGILIVSAVRYVIGVEMTLPGRRRPSVAFTGAALEREPAGPVFLLRARNVGNVILPRVNGSALITSGKRIVARVPLGPGTFVSQTSIAYPVSAFGEHPAEGARYRVRALLRYAGGVARLDTYVTFGHAQAALQRVYEPKRSGHGGGTAWWKIAGLGLLLVYAIGTSWLLLRRRQGTRGGGGWRSSGRRGSAEGESRAM
jgi:hypothetical protein